MIFYSLNTIKNYAMKSFKIFLCIAFILMTACKKSQIDSAPIASLNVINVVIGGKTLKLGSNKNDTILNMSSRQVGLLVDDNNIYLWPSGDSTNPYFNREIALFDGDVYSLFLAGNVLTQIDTLLIKESIIPRLDSTTGVRFINLSPNSDLNITLSTSSTVNEFSNLTYKQITNFKTYPASISNGNYVFQIRKTSDNTLVSSYTLTNFRFTNVTLVIKGLISGSPSIGVIQVKNDR